jgi:hypothetical protein
LSLTVTVQVAVLPSAVVAVIVAIPDVTPVTTPFESTAAIVLSLEVHATPIPDGVVVAVIIAEPLVIAVILPVLSILTISGSLDFQVTVELVEFDGVIVADKLSNCPMFKLSFQ